jgi:sugar O-acyltransferase (sialic acid O-acetyltransferase NeuD family)
MPFLTDQKISSIVIAGAGGFGLEVYEYLESELAGGGARIAGFIDDTPGLAAPAGTPLPVLGTITGFQPEEGQVVVVAIGSVKGRKSVLSSLWERNVATPPFVHKSSIVSSSAPVESGTIVCPFTVVNRNAIVERGVLLNIHCIVAHGAKAGAFSVLCPYTALNGDASIGEECFLGTRTTIYPRVSIGRECVVDSHTGVRISASDRQMISSRGTYQVSPLRT